MIECPDNCICIACKIGEYLDYESKTFKPCLSKCYSVKFILFSLYTSSLLYEYFICSYIACVY